MNWTDRDERLISSFVRLIKRGQITIDYVDENYPQYSEEVRKRLEEEEGNDN